MAILSDKTIKSLSAFPKHLVTMEFYGNPDASDQILKTTVDMYSNMSMEELTKLNGIALVKNIHSPTMLDILRSEHFDNWARIASFRLLTNEDAMAAVCNYKPMIRPFIDHSVRTMLDENNVEKRIISKGLTHAGYDVTLAPGFKVFKEQHLYNIDPLNFDQNAVTEVPGDFIVIEPGSFVLGVTAEKFDIPRDIKILCIGKSTYARCGLFVNCTNIQPGFKGSVVLELFNGSTLPIKVYANQGIAEFTFLQLDQPCEVSYADKGGKYQGQEGVVLPRA